MVVPFNDLKRHYKALKPLLDKAAQRVLNSGWYILGPEVSAFESEFSEYHQVPYCVTLGNGTDALEVALRSLGIMPGDEVITVANAGMYSTSAIRSVGAKPIFAEISPATYVMDPNSLAASITSHSRAVIVTHLYGRMAPMDELVSIARRNHLAVIEDCAQAHGAAWQGRKAGTWGDLGCFSFYPTKNLGALGDGGAVITADRQLADRIRSLRQYGWTEKYKAQLPFGRNSRLDELQAAFLRVQLPFLEKWNERRREIAQHYTEMLSNTGLILPAKRTDQEHVFHLYVVRHRKREVLRRNLLDQGIGCEVHYPIPDHLQVACRDLGYPVGALPISEAASQEVLSLPCFPELTEHEITLVIRAIRNSLTEI